MIRVAMWSGPRNVSTALMRSWGNRPDTFVRDEPLYAHYLHVTGLDHPAAAEVIASGETDWRKVVARLTSEAPPGKAVHYQKHMTHHLLPGVGRDWLAGVVNCFLIRDPREVLASYVRKNRDPAAEDVGFPQQAEIFDLVRSRTGGTPPVVDARDLLEDPRRTLGLLCDAVGVPFDEGMLSWPAGFRETDGVWAPHWYAEVAASTGFRPYRPKPDPVPDRLTAVYERCLEIHHRLHVHRLR